MLATGSRPTAPPIPGLADVPYLTNETIFANRTLPDHLIVIGGGPIGLELAQAHRRLGAQGHGAGSRRLPRQGRSRALRHRRGAPAGPKASTCARRVKIARRRTHGRRHGRDRWTAANAWKARICWSPPAARPSSRASTSTPPASPTPRAASRSMPRCARPTATSGRSATATASMPSPTWRATRRRCSSAAPCSARPRASMPRSCRGRPIPTPSWPRSA